MNDEIISQTHAKRPTGLLLIITGILAVNVYGIYFVLIESVTIGVELAIFELSTPLIAIGLWRKSKIARIMLISILWIILLLCVPIITLLMGQSIFKPDNGGKILGVFVFIFTIIAIAVLAIRYLNSRNLLDYYNSAQ